MSGLAAWIVVAALAPSPGHVRELIAADRWREAVEEAQAAVASFPDDLEAAGALGEALYRAGRISEAGEVLTSIAERDGVPGRALAQLGLVRAAEGKDAEAATLLERALAQSPHDPWVIYRASGAAATRARASRLLEDYIVRSAGEDADRVEGVRGTLRLYAALGERKIWIPSTRPERLEVPLSPLVGSRGRGWIVEARLTKRKSIRLLLDTGSTGLFVVERAVKKAGYAPLAEETVFAGGGNGRSRSARGILESLAIGGLSFRDALVTTTTEEFDPQGRIHGVLGISALAGYLVTLDLAKGRLVLEPAPATPQGAPYWNVGGQMLVRASAEGAPEDGLFLLDTGASSSMLAQAYASRVPGARDVATASVRTYGGAVLGASSVRGVTLAFSGATTRGDLVHQSDLTQRSRLGGVEVSGFLGLDLLDGTIIRIDTTRQLVAVIPASRG